jgi:hypothetical protein
MTVENIWAMMIARDQSVEKQETIIRCMYAVNALING